MDGGTFTISNGGVFGSLMGTPIINPPQSAILGMHGIFDRPVAVKGEVRKSSFVCVTRLVLVSVYYSCHVCTRRCVLFVWSFFTLYMFLHFKLKFHSTYCHPMYSRQFLCAGEDSSNDVCGADL